MSVTSRIPNILATDFIEPVAIFKNVFYVSVVKKQTKAKRTHCYSVVRKNCVQYCCSVFWSSSVLRYTRSTDMPLNRFVKNYFKFY